MKADPIVQMCDSVIRANPSVMGDIHFHSFRVKVS